MRLLLIRHAEARAATSEDEDGLTERGREQAAALGAVLAGWRGRTLVSPTPRAVETAALAGLAPDASAAFQKFRYGDGEVRERRDVQGGTLWRAEDRASPSGESLGEFQARVSAGLDGVVHEDEDTLIVAHGGVVLAALRWTWGLDLAAPWTADVRVPNASITELRCRVGDGAREPARYVEVERLGDVAHLAQMPG